MSNFETGDIVVVTAGVRTGELGKIDRVLRDEGQAYRVLFADGSFSIYFPDELIKVKNQMDGLPSLPKKNVVGARLRWESRLPPRGFLDGHYYFSGIKIEATDVEWIYDEG